MNPTQRFNRREWLATAAAVAGAGLLPGELWGLPGRIGAWSGATVADKIAPKVQPFPLTQVRLKSGPFLDAANTNLRYLHSLANDSLLHSFRLTAGIPSTAEPFGGWEAPNGELRGHYTGGHYLSACALAYASTGDEAIKAKADALVAELARCQKALNSNGYLGAYPTEFYDRLRDGKKVWAPFYTLHKIMAGHLDMYLYCGNEQALETVQGIAGWVDGWVKPLSDEQLAKIQEVEYGGMSEVLLNLYAVTGKPEYVALAKRFEQKKFFDPLAAHRDELKGLHTNTNIPKVIGAARAYELTGEQRYREIAEYFWNEITEQRAFATGNTSNGEHWNTDPGKMAEELGPAAAECCCAYNMLKLTRHVYGWTGEPHAMDYYERVLFNSRLGTQDPSGRLMYYYSMAPGLYKTFGTELHSFWCCTGTGCEEFAKLNDTIYFRDEQGVYVNLFIASELNWPEKGLRLVQDTYFPDEEISTLTVQLEKPQEMAVRVRIPYWVGKGAAIKINGKAQEVTARAGSYATLQRRWENGDQIEITLPMGLHNAPIQDDPTIQAMMYGPLVLAGKLGTEGLSDHVTYGDYGPDEKVWPMPEVAASGKNANDWLTASGKERMVFQTKGTKPTTLVPLYKLYGERYTVYWKVRTKV